MTDHDRWMQHSYTHTRAPADKSCSESKGHRSSVMQTTCFHGNCTNERAPGRAFCDLHAGRALPADHPARAWQSWTPGDAVHKGSGRTCLTCLLTDSDCRCLTYSGPPSRVLSVAVCACGVDGLTTAGQFTCAPCRRATIAPSTEET